MENKKGNIEREFGTNYTCIPSDILREKNISCKAKGLYATIMGLPKDWQLSVEGLQSILKEGRDAIYAALKELRLSGYVTTHQEVSNGRFGTVIYTVHANPCSTAVEKPHTENPHTEKPTQYNNINNIISNNISHTTREEENSWDSLNITEAWTENIQMCIVRNNGVMLSREEISQHLDNFKAIRKAQCAEFYESDARKHFVSYILKKTEQKQQSYGTSYNNSTPEYRRNEAAQLIAELIAQGEAAKSEIS